MKQITVKRTVEALHWIHNSAHHVVGTEWSSKTPLGEQTMENFSHVFYANYHEKIRVPAALYAEVSKYIRPNTRKFDTRMFALTAAGRVLVT